MRISYANHVTASDVNKCRREIETLLPTVKSGFQLLTDFTGLDAMDVECVPEIRKIMDTFREHGVSRVVRVNPEPHKEVGVNILSRFHYGPEVNVQTFKTLPEALKALEA